jgi:thioredoxin 1
MVNELNEQNFDDFIAKADKAVAVDFWADWCGPCRMLSPVLDEIANEMSSDLIIAKVNVDQNPALASRFGVSSIPAVHVIKQGSSVGQSLGFRPKADMTAFLRQHL